MTLLYFLTGIFDIEEKKAFSLLPQVPWDGSVFFFYKEGLFSFFVYGRMEGLFDKVSSTCKREKWVQTG
jgi:hypothetical protein